MDCELECTYIVVSLLLSVSSFELSSILPPCLFLACMCEACSFLARVKTAETQRGPPRAGQTQQIHWQPKQRRGETQTRQGIDRADIHTARIVCCTHQQCPPLVGSGLGVALPQRSPASSQPSSENRCRPWPLRTQARPLGQEEGGRSRRPSAAATATAAATAQARARGS